MASFDTFEFALEEALFKQVHEKLEQLSTDPLLPPNIAIIPPQAQGVYMLYYNGQVAYIGQSDAEAGLALRLRRHANRILDRPKLLGNVDFKALQIYVYSPMKLETRLIKKYSHALWNNKGFGSNDPGRNREDTNKPAFGFDQMFPIDIDRLGSFVVPGTRPISEVVLELKQSLPYCFRYETLRDAQGKTNMHAFLADMTTQNVTIPSGPASVRSLLRVIEQALSSTPGWNATQFPGHVILYKDLGRPYTYGTPV